MSELTYRAEIAAAVADQLLEAGTPTDPDLMLTLIARLAGITSDLAAQVDRLQSRHGEVALLRRGLEGIDRRVDTLEEATTEPQMFPRHEHSRACPDPICTPATRGHE